MGAAVDTAQGQPVGATLAPTGLFVSDEPRPPRRGSTPRISGAIDLIRGHLPGLRDRDADVARFCMACGAALVAPERAREARKVVTVVFADITGSTGLGERLDPETLRAIMGRWFNAMRTVLERHDGSVEKFIGG